MGKLLLPKGINYERTIGNIISSPKGLAGPDLVPSVASAEFRSCPT